MRIKVKSEQERLLPYLIPVTVNGKKAVYKRWSSVELEQKLIDGYIKI